MPLPDTCATAIDTALSHAEDCMVLLSQAMVRGQPDVLEAAARDLQQAAGVLAGVVQAPRKSGGRPDPVLTRRLNKVAVGLAMQREAGLRRLSVVERALHSIIPSTRPATYALAGKASAGAYRRFS